jgi:diguanylate cyclase (GGDEF)-like protein/PAS domain S-box-containing protein
VATFVDETDSLRDREALVRATKLVSTAFADAPVGMALVGLDGAWLKVNRSICELTGYTEAELLARTFQEITHPDDLDADLEQVQRLLAGEIERYAMEKRYYTAGGDLIWANLSVSLVSAPDGTPEHFISHIEDITTRKRLEQSLQRLADHDPLTELWNRRRFEEDLQRQVGRCKRYGEQAALFLLDLDDFKQVNDTLGHKTGDDLLRAVAMAMRKRLRSTDALARLGGDEFAVLVANVTPEQAAVLAEELAETIRSNRVRVRGREIGATASIGVAFLDRSVESDESVLIAADVAMYQAKAAGRDRTSTRLPAATDPRTAVAGIRVLLCDESGPYRRLVELMLEGYPDINLVGSVSEHAAAVNEAHRLRPDVVLLDARTPGSTDKAISAIRTVAPDCRVAILSALDEPRAAERRAADSFILKTRTFDGIAEAIREVHANRAQTVPA